MSNTRTVKNLFTRIISMGTTFIVTLAITNLVVSKLSRDVYGMYQLSNDFVNYAMVISIALNSMSSRYVTIAYYNKDIGKVNSYYNSILFANIILSLSLLIPIIIMTLNLTKIVNIPSIYVNDVKLLFFFMFINFLITVCTSVFNISTFVKNRVDLDSYRSIESNIIKLALVLLIYNVFEPRIWYLGICVIISNLYIVFRNIIYTRVLTPEIKLWELRYFKFDYIKHLISSGIWNSFTKVSAILLSGLDLIIANNLVSTSAMGMLSMAKTIPKYIISSMSSIASVFTPGIMIDYASKDKKKLVERINLSIEINSLFSLVVEVVIISLGFRIFKVWLPNQDANQLQLLSVISMIGYIIVMPFEVLWTIFTVTNRVKLSSIYLTIESIITLAMVFIFLQFTDNEITKLLIIAGTSSIFEIVRGLTFLPLASAYCLGVSKNTFYKPLIKFLMAFALSITVSLVLSNLPFPLSISWLFILCLIIMVITLFIGYIVIFSKKEKKRVQLLIKKMLRKYL